MKTYTIKAKQSNTGNIHDIASDNYDRVIKFNGDCKFAVVLAAYYRGGKGYTTHKTQASAIAKSKSLTLRDYSNTIIDVHGRTMQIVNNDSLVLLD